MKTTALLAALILMTALFAFPALLPNSANPASRAAQPAALRPAQPDSHLLPAGYGVPDALPASIQDPVLMTAWVYLWNQTAPLNTWDGQPLTGRDLAEYLRDQGVAVEWNTINDCGGNSCTERPLCKGQPCAALQEGRNHNPILVTTDYQNPAHFNLAELAGTIAHETIHHRLPFGDELDTLYEEFWAYSIGYQVSGSTKLSFAGVDTLKAACLGQWFQEHGFNYYSGFRAYPAGVEARADLSTASCVIARPMPGEVSGFPSGK